MRTLFESLDQTILRNIGSRLASNGMMTGSPPLRGKRVKTSVPLVFGSWSTKAASQMPSGDGVPLSTFSLPGTAPKSGKRNKVSPPWLKNKDSLAGTAGCETPDEHPTATAATSPMMTARIDVIRSINTIASALDEFSEHYEQFYKFIVVMYHTLPVCQGMISPSRRNPYGLRGRRPSQDYRAKALEIVVVNVQRLQ